MQTTFRTFPTRTLAALAFAIVAVAVLAGCGGDKTQRMTLLLFDDSVSADSMQARYNDIAETVARDLQGGERVVVGRITDASMRDARLPVDVKVPAFNPLNQTTGSHRKAVEKVRSGIKSGVEKLSEGRPAKCTDIVGATELAQKVFRNAAPGAEKRLLVVSDMIETCGPDFRRRELDGAAADSLLKKLRGNDRLPDLEGVRVWVAGATSTTDLATSRVRSIETFWIRFFEATGAEIDPGHYGPTLMGWGPRASREASN